MGGASDIAAYLKRHEAKPRLRFITCGSVDDGKSTLIGRLLYESKNLFDDQLSALERDSRRHGTQGEAIDYALLLDGLDAEREQGITIDVAYRYFSTDRRSYIVADCPGHEQYTRNMATGASTADLAVVLVDARKGLLTADPPAQLHRRAVRHPARGAGGQQDGPGRLLAARSSTQIAAAYRRPGRARWASPACTAIPLSGLVGDNVVARSAAMPWYQGPALLEYLDDGRPRRRPGARPAAVPHAGAVGLPALAGLPRIHRPGRRRRGPRRRRSAQLPVRASARA